MKNQYFGDVNDYQKYGILRQLVGPDVALLVCWMLTPDDERRDGRHTRYLGDPTTWRRFDPELFDCLREEVLQRDTRRVSVVEQRGLLPDATYVNSLVPGRSFQASEMGGPTRGSCSRS